MSQKENNTRDHLIDVATSEFCSHGFKGASVRDICSLAGASANAITYHFGSKQNLYDLILSQFADLQVTYVKRTLVSTFETKQEFLLRLEMFFEGMLDSYLANREVLLIALRDFEQRSLDKQASVYSELVKTNFLVSNYITAGKEKGFVADDIDADIVAGIMLDRLVNQARFTHNHKQYFDVTTLDEEYRAYWVKATLRVLLGGLVAQPNPDPRLPK